MQRKTTDHTNGRMTFI